MRWGFVPHWYKTLNGGPLIINARAETIAEKPAFADAVRRQRCLIPATGFYEWHRAEDKSKTPFWVHPAPQAASNLPLVAFAGIWCEWHGPEGPVRTCAIVTTTASTALASIHHRAPLALAEENWPLWLGEAGKGAARLMTPPAEDFWAFHEVDAAVGNRKSDGPELMEAIQPPTT
jgi:putative SOS response-associated peptidase YedK